MTGKTHITRFALLSRLKRAAFLAVAILGIAGVSAVAVAEASRYWDPVSKKWIVYNPKRVQEAATAQGGTPKRFRRTVVDFETAERPGTIIIDADQHFLYLVQPGFKAIRYGVGVGREGFGWSGVVTVGRKAEWPTWTPPADMIERDPKLVKYASGMPGGSKNPLGARAMYLHSGGKDTLYRIHGTNEPWSIGLNVSSGCIRLNNEDIKHLYDRVDRGAKVIVLMSGAALYDS
ncbi:lipoprotein-anchoring transpeptidase ErfK/SrfK [Rhodobium orientis]|uniref:Carnitine operon oxidoreductase n=1 Tax=Rhodobium orientis TaxID=34017 RepID=A0A327JJG5_9HYPH|nr:L,D-transpeptidase [Rhodobium orientis]MBB4302406.1 lipoprotein-anchoring transpeptidase ErfK/SrfK [Rhodobium orientis]MBK5949110.1 carnitine operon oxidoreductase [Rhodobium orientis]RAI26570.1 carnitine operon oxidoreductase [Rhodobium orientis]